MGPSSSRGGIIKKNLPQAQSSAYFAVTLGVLSPRVRLQSRFYVEAGPVRGIRRRDNFAIKWLSFEFMGCSAPLNPGFWYE